MTRVSLPVRSGHLAQPRPVPGAARLYLVADACPGLPVDKDGSWDSQESGCHS